MGRKPRLVSFAGYKLRDNDGTAIGVLAMFAKHPISEEDDAFITNLAETTSRVIMDHQVAEELRTARDEAEAGQSGEEPVPGQYEPTRFARP